MTASKLAPPEPTLEEKAALSIGATAWTTAPIDHLAIPALRLADGPHGLRLVADPAQVNLEGLPATCFPTAACAASSWDPELLAEMAAAIADEARAAGVHVVLGPGVNIKRSPLGGRNFEYFSEDPFLAGELAVSYIRGMQLRGVGASLKHFAVNNLETRRMTIDAIVDERALREIYLPAFEAAVTRAHPWTVMCSYNRVNGVHVSQHRRLLTEILRDEWGFDGVVVSDWGAVQDRVASLVAGLDLEMPGPRPRRAREVVDAARDGRVEAADLDRTVRRLSELGRRVQQAGEPPAPDSDHHALARRVAADSMVLLRNDGVLPLRDISTLAVIGRTAVEPRYQGGGSSQVNTQHVDIPLDELRRRPGIVVDYLDGYPPDGTANQAMIDDAAVLAARADVAIVFAGLPSSAEVEGTDRENLDLPSHQQSLIRAVCAVQPRTVIVLNNGAPVTMSGWIDGTAAVIEAWLPGESGGSAIADILFGDMNPSGKLPETFPLRLQDTPSYLNHPGEGDSVRYGEGIFVGYRGYDALAQPVLFPFGHGLSYTTFRYGTPRLSHHTIGSDDTVTVSVDVTNVGACTGKEVVQVYIADRVCSLPRPPKELKGFAKVELAPGESRRVEVDLSFRSFAFFHPGHGRWVVEGGDFDVLIGSSSADIRCTCTIAVRDPAPQPSLLSPLSTLGDWLADATGREVLQPRMPEILERLFAGLGHATDDPTTLEPAVWNWKQTMPLSYVLDVGAEEDSTAPVDAIADLLTQVRQRLDPYGPSTYLEPPTEPTRTGSDR